MVPLQVLPPAISEMSSLPAWKRSPVDTCEWLGRWRPLLGREFGDVEHNQRIRHCEHVHVRKLETGR
jgi:hypothetical protein